MLGLSVLLLGIAGVVFVGVITDLEPWSQLAILAGVAAVALAVAPPVAHRGLTATAETIAVVGLLVIAIAGYAVWSTGVVGAGRTILTTGPVYSGLVAAVVAAAGYGYHLLTGLDLPRWTALLALQPVLPLLAYPLVTGPAGWALVFTLVAVHNAALGTATGRRPLGYVTWILHAVAVAVALTAATAGLTVADGPVAALPPAVMLVLAALTLTAGVGYGVRRDRLTHVAAAVLTLAVMVAASRVLVLALPGRALLPVALVAAATALGVRLLPAALRRGPLLAVVAAFAGIGVLVAGLALRTGFAAIVWPPWPDGLAPHQQGLAAAAAATTGWQLAATAGALTLAAGVVTPAVARWEATAVGAVLTALAAPASLSLDPAVAPWPAVVATAGLALAGLVAATRRAAKVLIAAGTVTALAATGAALAAPPLTATVLAALTLTGAVVGSAPTRQLPARAVTEWAAGGATLALPAAATTGAVAAGLPPPGVLVVAFAAVCGSLGYAVAAELRHQFVPVPVRIGTGAATVAVAALAVAAPDAIWADRVIAVLLVAALALLLAAPRMERIQLATRVVGTAELAAATLTAAVIATLARVAGLLAPIAGPDAVLATAATLVFLVTLAIGALPPRLRRGPVLGVAVLGGLLAAVAGAAAVASGAAVFTAPGSIWGADLDRWWPPDPTVAGLTWAAPYALGLFAVAAAIVLPRPAGARASGALGFLTVVAAPAALGLDWWTPAALATAAGAGYALSAAAGRARDAMARAATGGALLLYAVGAALVRPWTTAAVLGVGMVTAAAVIILVSRLPRDDPRHRVAGVAVAGALLALPGAVAALAAQLGHDAELRLLAALAAATLGLAALAALSSLPPASPHTSPSSAAPPPPTSPSSAAPPPASGTRVTVRIPPELLGFGTVGVAASATGVAFAAMPTAQPAGVYAAAAVLLAVLAELLRAARWPPGHRSLVRPPIGALLAGAVPSVIALLTLAPALRAALVTPYQTLAAIWDGPPSELLAPEAVGPGSVIAALVLTLAAALAAVGFGGAVTQPGPWPELGAGRAGRAREAPGLAAVPLVAPGLAVTLLIAPAALRASWPASTVAALAVFTIAMLGVALSPPPPVNPLTRPLRAVRHLVLVIGLAAGGAGLAGALADPGVTWATCGGAVGVGAAAALWGRTGTARLLGWVGAIPAAHGFTLLTAYLSGVSGARLGFGPLAVAAVSLLLAARIPRRSAAEIRAVEWLGGYAGLLAALVFTFASLPDLASVLIVTGAVLGLNALRPGHSTRWRRGLLWTAASCEIAAWWLIMWVFAVPVLEAYTLPFALFALLVGALELRYRPELGSWFTWGPGLVAALAPSLLLVLISTTPQPARQTYLILAGAAILLLGSRLRQQAPVIVGTTVTAVAALHLLSLAGPWLVLIPLGLLMLVLAATREKRLRDLQRLRDLR